MPESIDPWVYCSLAWSTWDHFLNVHVWRCRFQAFQGCRKQSGVLWLKLRSFGWHIVGPLLCCLVGRVCTLPGCGFWEFQYQYHPSSVYIYIYHIDLYRTIYTHCAICMHPHPQISMFGGVSHTNWKTYYIYLYIHSSLHTVPLSNTGTGERLLVILEGTSSGKTCIQYLIISIYWARIYSLSCACLVPQDCGDRSPVGFWCQTGSQDISQSIAWFQIQFWIWTVNYWTWINMIILKLEKTDEQHTTWKAFSTFHMCDFMEYANIYIHNIYIHHI